MELTDNQKLRYSRNILLKDIDADGQEKLLASRVLVIGAGGLGSPAILYLAAAGVGTIGIADGDRVDVTNLQRQIIHTTAEIGKEKTQSAGQKVAALNPDVKVELHQMWLDRDNIVPVIKSYDFVIDATDNFDSKFLINDCCVEANVPYCHAGVTGFEGQVITVIPNRTTCYRCIFGSPPPAEAVPSCSQAGILGATAGLVGTIQAAEAIKYLLGIGEGLTNQILTIDFLKMSFRKVAFKANPACKVCSASKQPS